MITLQPITEQSFCSAIALRVKPEQQEFVASATGILARGYLYRRQNSRVWAIYHDLQMVGLALYYDLEDEPACYHLCELMIDGNCQGRGFGQAALKLLIEYCRKGGKYPRIEVCVRKNNPIAIHMYLKAGFYDTGYVDPELPDFLCLSYDLPRKFECALDIHLTEKADLLNIQRLWGTPEVMRFVGFPNGLHETMEHLENEWLPWIETSPVCRHWSIYADSIYCGESFYSIDNTGLAAMDIKLMPEARGKGIAFAALSFALDAAFDEGGAERAYVDPDPENRDALTLYAALGFLPAKRPSHLDVPECPFVYLEMSRGNWEVRHGN